MEVLIKDDLEWKNENCMEQAHLFFNHFDFRAASFGISLLFRAVWKRFISLEGEDVHTSAHGDK